MAKHQILLKAFQKNLGEWVCRMHNSDVAQQPASTFRELKKLGYKFEKVSARSWAKRKYCKVCENHTTHSKLLEFDPVFTKKPRINIPNSDRARILKLFKYRDAFTGGTISSTPEIDHKIPWSRLEQDIDTSNLSDNEIVEHFQLLTGEHNLLKDRACSKCINTNIRPPFLEIEFWYEGDKNFKGLCDGCGWYDGVKWRNELNKII